MKTLKDFIQSPIEESNMEILESSDLPDFIEEDKQGNDTKVPPAMLIMRRKSFRKFPDGQMVALYYIDKINKYVTVPYTSAQLTAVKEETTLDVLNSIVENKEGREIIHKNGNSTNVNNVQAEKILEVYKQLSADNKNKLVEMVEESKRQFKEAYQFVLQNSK